MDVINIDDFGKLDLRIATILEAKEHPKADKLMILKVSLTNEERQIVASIRPYYKAEDLKGVQIVIVANLEPRTLRGETSHGMLLAVKDENTSTGSVLSLLVPDKIVGSGLKVG